MTFLASIGNYIEVTKPKTVALLVFTSVATTAIAALSAKWFVPSVLLAGLIAITAASAGCNTVTCYIDRDIDKVMRRTSHRPIPTDRIEPAERALVWGLGLIALGLVIGLWINLVSFVILALGVLDNVVVYSLWLKRRSSLNIILGGFSGGLPAMFGWSMITGTISLLPILLAALVVLWIPSHIWSLAILSKEDYALAGVPMLPVVMKEKVALRCIVATVLLMIPFSLAIYSEGGFSWIYAASASCSGCCRLGVECVFVFPSDETERLPSVQDFEPLPIPAVSRDGHRQSSSLSDVHILVSQYSHQDIYSNRNLARDDLPDS